MDTLPLLARLNSLLGKILCRAAQLMQIGQRITAKRRDRTMRLCETLSLGERRFLALVLVEQQKFLVGGSGSSIALLARLPSPPDSATPSVEV